MNRFLAQLMRFLILTASISWVAMTIYPLYFCVQFWGIYAFFALLSVSVFFFTAKSMGVNGAVGIGWMMAAWGVKLIVCMIAAAVMILAFHLKSLAFLSNFFTLYLLFLFFEIYTVLRNLRLQKNNTDLSKNAP